MVTTASELQATVEKQKLERLKLVENIQQMEQSVLEFDKNAEQGIDLLYRKTGTSKEEFEKRYAKLLDQYKS